MQDLAVHIVQNSAEFSGKYPYLSDVLGKTLRQTAEAYFIVSEPIKVWYSLQGESPGLLKCCQALYRASVV